MSDILIVIPVYNCNESAKLLIEKLKPFSLPILIVDDGSDISFEYEYDKLFIIRHNKNRGKGAALITGFEYAINNGYKFVLTMDGDLQHSPDDLDKFLKVRLNYDIVIGKRDFKDRRMPIHRKLSNYLTSKILSFILKVRIEDAQSGYRLIKTDILKKITLETRFYDMENELLIKAVKIGAKVGFVPIKTIYNESNSNIRGIRDTLAFLKVVIKYGLSR